ncbi:MAG TPA: SIMPL domain-containing protein [Nocardioidaceae bacterium]|nr:SIMPL domain-containing protein [Nocardioidaceae bacterium]
MDKRNSASLVALVAVLLGVLGAYAIGAGQRGPAAVAAETEPPTRSIAIDAVGEVRGVPDQVAFDLSVRGRAVDLAGALDRASATMRRVLDVLADQGVDRKDVQTTGLSMDPVYRYLSGSEPILEGYRVVQRAEVVVRSLRDAGKVITAAVGAGDSTVSVSDLRLQLGDRASLLSDAREKAIAEAEAKAEQYAGAAGQTLGAVLSIKETTAQAPQYLYENAFRSQALAADLASSVPIRAGSEQVKVTVSVVWGLD